MELLSRKKEKIVPRENPVLLKQLEEQVAEVFKIFDFYGMNNIQCESVGHVFRMLGCVPLEKDIIEFAGLCENPTEKGKIRFVDFFKTFFAWLLEERMKPADADGLLNSLKLINAGEGITENRLRQVTLEYGEGMSDEQLKTMIAIAVDKKMDKVIFDTFAHKLHHNPKYSIYDLAKDIVKPIEPDEAAEIND